MSIHPGTLMRTSAMRRPASSAASETKGSFLLSDEAATKSHTNGTDSTKRYALRLHLFKNFGCFLVRRLPSSHGFSVSGSNLFGVVFRLALYARNSSRPLAAK